MNWRGLANFYINTFDCKIVYPNKNIQDNQPRNLVTNSHLNSIHLLLPGYGQKGPTLTICTPEQLKDNQCSNLTRMRLGYITFSVNNIISALLNVEKNGGEFSGEVTKIKLNKFEEKIHVYVSDPEGNLIQLESCKNI